MLISKTKRVPSRRAALVKAGGGDLADIGGGFCVTIITMLDERQDDGM